LALAASTAFAQKTQTYRPKKSANIQGKKPAKAAPMVKTPGATSNASKDLLRIEQQSVKAPAGVKPVGPKGAGSASAFKPAKSRPTPPITAGVPGGMGTSTKGMGTATQGKNPYKGRLRQKGTHQ
jgi:hypothetical protein